jgi:CysZ protein
MQDLWDALRKTVKSLFSSKVFGVMIMTVVATVFTLMGFMALIVFLLSFIPSFLGFSVLDYLPFAGYFTATFITLLLFPILMPVILSFFDVQIIEAIEARDYPKTKPQIKRKYGSKFLRDMRFVLIVLVVNILVIPFYLIPFLNIILFPLLNGFLFGREFFMINARRHLTIKDAKKLRREHSGIIVLAGILFMMIAMIPLVNLIAPFWGIALMTHLFHKYYIPPKHEEENSGYKIL